MQRYNMVEMKKIPESAAAIGVGEKVTNLTKKTALSDVNNYQIVSYSISHCTD